MLTNFDILTEFDKPPLKQASLRIEDGRIDRIFPHTPQELSSEERVIEGKGRLLLPGFVDTHTHLGMTIFRGYADDLPLQEWLEEEIWPAESHLTEEEVYWGSLLGMIELIRSGATAFADMYFFMDSTARAALELGMRGLLSYGIIAQELNNHGREEIAQGMELVENWKGKGDGKLDVALSPHAPYTCGDEVWEEIVRLSQGEEITIHTHVSETEREVEQSHQRRGMSPVQRLDRLGVLGCDCIAAHCVKVSAEDIQLLKKHGVRVSHNPTSNMKLGSGVAPVGNFLQEGMTVGLGTDGPSSNNDLDMFEEMRLASFLQKVDVADPTILDASSSLYLATAGGAEVLGYDDLGVIKPGYRADLIALNRDRPYWKPEFNTVSNVVYTGKSADVDMVMVDGDLLMDRGEILCVDERKVLKKVQEISLKYKDFKRGNRN